jgi:hypothetical protein
MKCIIKSQAPEFFKKIANYYNNVTGKSLKYIYAKLPDDERQIPMGVAYCNFDTFLNFIAVQASTIKEEIGDFTIRITTRDTEEPKTDNDLTIGELKRAWSDRPEVVKTLDTLTNVLGKRLKEQQISEQDNADAEVANFYAQLSAKRQKKLEETEEAEPEPDYELVKKYSTKSNEFLLRAMAREKKPFHMIMPEEHKEIEIVSNYFILKQGADFADAALEVCDNLRAGDGCSCYSCVKRTISPGECTLEFIRSTEKGSHFITFNSFGEFLKKFKEFLEENNEEELFVQALKSSTEHIEEI